MKALKKFRLIRDALEGVSKPSTYFVRKISRWIWESCEWCEEHTVLDEVNHVQDRDCKSCPVLQRCEQLREFGSNLDRTAFLDEYYWKKFREWVLEQIEWLEGGAQNSLGSDKTH